MRPSSSLLLGLLLLAGGASLPAQAGKPAPALPPVREQMLVSTRWLAEHLKDPEVVIVHVADQVADYKRGHIPGARFLAAAKFIDNLPGQLGSELPPVESLARTFTELGIGERSRVVIYATNWGPNAARAWFTLEYLGHGARASLLDGGVEMWLAEDRPVTGEVPVFGPAPFTPKPRPEVVATTKDVVAGTELATAQFLDSRPPRRFVAGHLKGAVNVYWQDALESEDRPRFQSAGKLRELLTARGLLPGKPVISYCEVGLQACYGYFLARYLGFEAAMYDGSYQEWTSKNLPVVKSEGK